MDTERVRQEKITRRALTLAVSVLGVTTLVGFFRWSLVDYLTPFLEPVLEAGIFIAFLVSLIWSIVNLFQNWRDARLEGVFPLFVNVATVLIATFVPFTSISTSVDFSAHLKARSAVVDDVLGGKYDGRIQSSGPRGDLIALPNALSSLSRGGGEIVRFRRQSDTLILFFDYRGVLSSFSGFVYSSSDLPPNADAFGGNFFEIQHFQKNWFWVSSRN